MPENQTEWKSDNQGVKEGTFIHTGRRGRDGHQGGEDSRQGRGWGPRMGGGWQAGWSHICMQINWEEQLGSETDRANKASKTCD